jgi:hypothetical protein
MFDELDTVVLTHDINEHGLVEGDLGTIVHSYSDEEAFEVEFVTSEGKTIALVALSSNDIRPIASREILHVREFATAQL